MTTRDIEAVDYGVPVWADMRSAAMGGGRIVRFPHEFLMSMWGRLMATRVRSAVMQYPWYEKQPVLFWRGGMTGRWLCPTEGQECQLLEDYHSGHQWNLTHWHLGTRGRAALLQSFAPPGLVDMKFTSKSGMTSEVQELLRSRAWLDDNEPKKMLEDQFRAKYLLITDDSDRAYWMATGNSLMFMTSSTILRGCGLAALKPWVHFVPIRPDLSDALERVLWAQQHDEEARAIAARGSAFAREAFSQEAQLFCLFRMLEQYAARLED
eukprot:TRINITY_DN94103_c0_g1_i1.p1 TRINITY_DN94103_c0_g1~~TRINITY_DN94103_c0_g1_i1.p1  ORF type:complete len:304 (-),score=61.04 TRINITY_DN94103_c0_g1_i1:117-914(-)